MRPVIFTRADVCRFTDVTPPSLKNLIRGRVLRKRPKGTGNPTIFTLDDVLKTAVAKALLRIGASVASIRAAFVAIDTPRLPGAVPWAWLRTPAHRTEGAFLYIITAHPSLPIDYGAICLMPEAAARTVEFRAGRSILIDVGALIRDVEARTGMHYGE